MEMSKQELNQAIRNFWKKYLKSKEGVNTSGWGDKEWSEHYAKEKELKTEFKRLWDADKKKGLVGVEQLKMLLIIN